jgi:hypothetical protein
MKRRLLASLLVLASTPALAASPLTNTLRVADVQPLGSEEHAVIAAPSKSAAIADGLAPAPMPNPDIDPPHGDGTRIPELSPALLSSKLDFQGNGYAPASSQAYAIDQRTKPAAGLNWSVTVK